MLQCLYCGSMDFFAWLILGTPAKRFVSMGSQQVKKGQGGSVCRFAVSSVVVVEITRPQGVAGWLRFSLGFPDAKRRSRECDACYTSVIEGSLRL